MKEGKKGRDNDLYAIMGFVTKVEVKASKTN